MYLPSKIWCSKRFFIYRRLRIWLQIYCVQSTRWKLLLSFSTGFVQIILRDLGGIPHWTPLRDRQSFISALFTSLFVLQNYLGTGKILLKDEAEYESGDEIKIERKKENRNKKIIKIIKNLPTVIYSSTMDANLAELSSRILSGGVWHGVWGTAAYLVWRAEIRQAVYLFTYLPVTVVA